MTTTVVPYPMSRVEKIIDGYQARFRVGADGRPSARLLREYGAVRQDDTSCGYEAPSPGRAVVTQVTQAPPALGCYGPFPRSSVVVSDV